MVSAKPLYGGERNALARTPRAGVMQDAAHLGGVERLRDQVVGAEVEGLRPETGVGLRVGDNDLELLRGFAGQTQGVEPVTVGEGGFGEDDVVLVLAKLSARVPQRACMVHL